MKKILIINILLLLNFTSCDKENKEVVRNDNAVKITNSAPQSSQNPCFSPDGEYIVFTRFLEGYNAGPSEIVKMKVDGSNEEVIVPAANAGNVNVPFGSWVDNKICFASDRAGLADEIWTVDDDGSNLKQITTHSEADGVYYIEPVFNPQNTSQIVFEYVTGEDDDSAIHQIAFLNVNTGDVTLLTDGTLDDRLPSWSNDGTRIIFQRNHYEQNTRWKIYVADIHTDNTYWLSTNRLISFGASDYTDCSWSYDDEYIISSSPFGELETPNIWMFPVDASLSPIQKTFSSTNEDGAPSQSHDGQSIVFESHYGDSEEEPSEIWIIKE